MIEELSIIEVWNKLEKIKNDIEYLETDLITNYDIKPNKLKEILVSCTSHSNDTMINAIIRNDKQIEKLRKLYIDKNNCENYILKEINRMKLSEPALAIAFLKEYKKMTWHQISKQLDYSEKSARRYYAEYKGKTPKNNTFLKDDQI